MKKAVFILFLTIIPALAFGQADEPFRYDTLYRNPRPQQTGQAVRQQSSQPVQAVTRTTGDENYGSAPAARIAKDRKGRWHIGGNMGMGFGDYTNISIAPQIGYSWNKYFTLGGGISYNYYEHKRADYSLNYLGMHLYGRAYPIDYITLYAQPELQRRWGRVRDQKTSEELFGCLLLGAGVVIPAGNRGGMIVTFYYDVIQNPYSPYGNRIGYSVGYSYSF